MVNGIPVIYNKADNTITSWQAEREFNKAVRTMHTWASRFFRLVAAHPDAELREYELERIGWDLDNIETWVGAMREGLEETRGKQRKQDTIDKLLALANDPAAFPDEAETARRMAERKQNRRQS
jgi:hypothetical protein